MKQKNILYLKVNEIKKSRTSIRKNFEDYRLNNLVASISAVGVINPLIVRINENGEYEVISGNRRLEAAIKSGLAIVPCILKKSDKKEALILSICENTTSEKFNFFEEAEALYTLIKEYKLTIIEAASKVGLSPSAFRFKTSLLRLNSIIQKRIIEENLSVDFARILLKVEEDKRQAFLEKIIGEKLSLKSAEEEAQKLASAPKNRYTKTIIGDPKLFSNSLNKMVDTMNLSGVKVLSETVETEKGIEYRLTIPK